MGANRSLIAAVIGSVLLHLAALEAALRISPGQPSLTASLPTADEIEETTPTREPDWHPGIERSPHATVNWIGYEEYEEHLAHLAEVEQAALTQTAARGDPLSESLSMAPPTEQPVPAPETVAPAPEPSHEHSDDLPALDAPVPELDPRVLEAAEAQIRELVRAVAQRVEELAQTATARQEVEPPPVITEETSVEAESIESIAEVEPRPDSAPPPGEPEPAQAASAQRDSPATSTIEVAIERLGRPIAVEGLEIRPFSPYRHIVVEARDTQFQYLLSRGGWAGRIRHNPIVSLRFDRDGRAGEVRILRTSGFAALDERHLRAWLSRWTAAGRRLDDLAEGELTGAFNIKLVFVPERR